jgi:hypothetical protein
VNQDEDDQIHWGHNRAAPESLLSDEIYKVLLGHRGCSHIIKASPVDAAETPQDVVACQPF